MTKTKDLVCLRVHFDFNKKNAYVRSVQVTSECILTYFEGAWSIARGFRACFLKLSSRKLSINMQNLVFLIKINLKSVYKLIPNDSISIKNNDVLCVHPYFSGWTAQNHAPKLRAIDQATSKYLYIHSEVTRTDRAYAFFILKPKCTLKHTI